MTPQERMVAELLELVKRWIERGESPTDGVWVLGYAAMLGVKTAPPMLVEAAEFALTDGLKAAAE